MKKWLYSGLDPWICIIMSIYLSIYLIIHILIFSFDLWPQCMKILCKLFVLVVVGIVGARLLLIIIYYILILGPNSTWSFKIYLLTTLDLLKTWLYSGLGPLMFLIISLRLSMILYSILYQYWDQTRLDPLKIKCKLHLIV